ncbi:MAG: ligase-associated DNA damage response exonuclease [Planctomycetes bacterium]|nr:ligase-associated DNA damage response exonuclease [Planctomycetota bacterium]
MSLVENTERGLYCRAGDFYIDPWSPVDRAVITHSHSDHLRWGSKKYLTAAANVPVLTARVGPQDVEGLPYGESVVVNGVKVSFYPAGHVLGSAQVRIEYQGDVCVASGDYKVQPDRTCAAFEPVRCRHFITEATFALPIYRWQATPDVMRDVDAWWQANAAEGRTSVICAYSLGKAQRVLAELLQLHGPLLVHGALQRFLPIYREAGVTLPETAHASATSVRAAGGKALVVAPPSVLGGPWLRKFGPVSTAVCSGWMRVRGTRRRRGVDRGFVLSDHADWPGLCEAIAATGAEEVWVTHGYTEPFARYLSEEKKLYAIPIETRFKGEALEETLTETDAATTEDAAAEQQAAAQDTTSREAVAAGAEAAS